MESLYRKYRPQTFADVVGQQHVVGTLEHAVLENRTSHAYLFCGPRGTGKTTMARLLAKALMCEQGPGHLPDGTCEQCALIAAGDHPDVYELDAASRTGVDNVREEIINSVGYAPTRGRCKMYIIDEVHMLTTAAFNALLKTLEEPPDHVVFVLCTTDPQKIPATILSRVQRFDFRPIGNDDIRRHLAYVCEQEGFTYEDAALDLVTAHARGGMRDALSTLEQLSVFGGGVIGLEAAQDLLGAVSGSALVHVMDALARRDVPALFEQVGSLVNAGRDLLQFARELAAHVRDVYVAAAVGANPAVLPAGSDVERLRAEAAAMGSVDRLSRMLLLLGDVSKEMGTAPNQRLVLEIAFTRMARPEVDLTLESLAERVEELELKLANLGPSVTAAHNLAASVPIAKGAGVEPQTITAVDSRSEESQTSGSGPAHHAQQQVTRPATQAGSAPSAAHGQAHRSAPQMQSPAQQSQQTVTEHPVQQRVPQRASQAEPQQTAQRHSSAPQSAQPAAVQQRPMAQSQPAPQPAPRPAPQPAPQAQPKSSQARPQFNPGALQRAWRQVVSDLMMRIPARGTLLSNAVATSDNGTELVISLPKGSSFALKMLERPDIKAVVEQSVAQAFGPRTLVFKEGADSSSQAPSPRNQQATQRTRAPQSSRFEQINAPAYATPPSPYADQLRAPGARPATPYTQPSRFGQQTGQESARPASAAAPSAPQPDYPLPWDNPAQSNRPAQPVPAQPPAPTPAPAEPPTSEYDDQYYDVVPYEELGAFSQDYDEQGYSYDFEPAPAETSQVASPAKPTSAARQSAPSAPQPSTFGAQQESKPASMPNQQPASSSEAGRPQTQLQSDSPGTAPESAPESASVDVLVGPDELPPELARILEDAFEVFGNGVRATKES